MRRSRRQPGAGRLVAILAPAAALLLLLAASPASAQTLVHGDGDTARYDIVFLGDGFTAAEQAAYAAKVSAATAALLATDVYRDHKDAINVWRVDTVSKASGIDDPAKGVTRDTAFDLTFGVGGVQRCIGAATSAGLAAIAAAAAKAPGRDRVIVLANAPEFGGCSFSSYSASSVAKGFETTVAHELGHGIGGLADEYEVAGTSAYSGAEPPWPNCAKSLAPLKWAALLTSGVALPTPEVVANKDKVGAFEGCRYHPKGIYRPAYDCKMRASQQPFCPVCAARMREVLGRFQPGSRDLAVTALTISLAGGTFSLDATVCNRGRAATPAIDVAFFLHRASAPGCADAAASDAIATLPPLSAGACQPLSVSTPLGVSMPAFTYKSWLLADAGCAVAEPSEADNARASDHVLLTDVSLRDVKAAVTGRDLRITGKVCVTGRALALPVQLGVWPGSLSPLPCATDALALIPLAPPAAGTCAPVTLDATALDPGAYTLWLRASATACLKLEKPGTVADNDARVTFTIP